MAAVRGYICDWDSFTLFRGKNGYFYRRPDDGKFQFLQWDSDLAFRESATRSTATGWHPGWSALTTISGSRPTWPAWWN